jgi:hypothetical protein
MRLEHGFYAIASVLVAAADTASVSHEYVLWAGSGTLVGSFLASQAPTRSKSPVMARMGIAFIAGLIVAPWFIGYLPKPDSVPQLFHVFGSSGVAAACGYLIFTEYPKIVLEKIRSQRYNDSQANRKDRDDNDSGDGAGA